MKKVQQQLTILFFNFPYMSIQMQIYQIINCLTQCAPVQILVNKSRQKTIISCCTTVFTERPPKTRHNLTSRILHITRVLYTLTTGHSAVGYICNLHVYAISSLHACLSLYQCWKCAWCLSRNKHYQWFGISHGEGGSKYDQKLRNLKYLSNLYFFDDHIQNIMSILSYREA